MGSFNATCIVSNLPIECGDKVRFLALTESAYHEGNEHVCYVGGRWQVRCAPVKAEYNDYGSIENWEESVTTDLFFKSFDTDVVEKGIGDNQCHDVRVRIGMSYEDWLGALWEGRVEVTDDGNRTSNSTFVSKDEYVQAGLPTIYRIEKIITDAGFENTKEYRGAGYIVDDVIYGFVRVRHGSYSTDSVELEKLLPFIQKAGYAAMITCGSGSYSDYSEILVAPIPGKDDRGLSNRTSGLKGHDMSYYDPRPVSMAMIREDVWQILLNTPIDSWHGKYTFDKVKADSIKTLNEVLDKNEEIKRLEKENPEDSSLRIMRLLLLTEMDDFKKDNLFSSFLSPREGESGFTLKRAFKFAIEQEDLSKEDLIKYVEELAEMAYVQCVYSQLHGQWHPTTNSGQESNWKEHRAFLQKLQEIKGRYEEDDEEYMEELGEDIDEELDEDEDELEEDDEIQYPETD